MKVISLLQPWATLVVIGAKKIETRSWNTNYRGDILIHASKRKIRVDEVDVNFYKHLFDVIPQEKYCDLPYGAIIGKAELVTTSILCPPYKDNASPFGIYFNDRGASFTEQELAFGNYEAGRYGWLLSNPVQFKHNYKINGSLNLWPFDERICLQCGCTDADACFDIDIGPCSWVEENLCSHCQLKINSK